MSDIEIRITNLNKKIKNLYMERKNLNHSISRKEYQLRMLRKKLDSSNNAPSKDMVIEFLLQKSGQTYESVIHEMTEKENES